MTFKVAGIPFILWFHGIRPVISLIKPKVRESANEAMMI